jgi:hypothetical protein
MPDVHQKMKTNRLVLTGAKVEEPLDPLRTGMPALDSIHDAKVRFKATPKGPTYRILKTTEVDSYETTPTAQALTKALRGRRAPAPAAIAAAVRLKPLAGENFAGSERKGAKLSIAAAPTEKFNDVSKLIDSLTSVDVMSKISISTSSSSNRVQQENRNVHVTGLLYAASREPDNDFHLIVGRDLKAVPEMYMTMVVSGLPWADSPAFGSLKTARTAYGKFFGNNLPGACYDFYDPPIPIQIDGSLFFNAPHSLGQWPGPPSLKSRMPTIWEVHPISHVKLGP